MFGYESTLFLGNAGFGLYVLWGHLLIYLIYLFTYKVGFLRRRIGNYLFWNTLIRLYCEMFFEMLLVATLNIKTMDWSSPFKGVICSNVLSIFVIIIVVSSQIAMFCFYRKKLNNWTDDTFQDRYGALLDGTKNNSKTITKGMLLFYITLYFLRRMIFVICVFLLEEHLWFQIAI